MMNRVQPENVHSTIFTPREYQVELVDACLKGNTLSVLASRSTRTFLITMVTREMAHLTRSKEQRGKGQRTLITGWSGPGLVRAGEAIQQNTNLAVTTYTRLEQVEGWLPTRWSQTFTEGQVIIMTVDVLEKGLETGLLQLDMLNLLVITDAHRMATFPPLIKVLNLCRGCRILGMTSPVLSHACSPPQLESFLTHLQGATSCMVDTSSEIVTVLRYVNKPVEKIVMCRDPDPDERSDVELEVRRLVKEALCFLDNHRYDLVEVYGPEYQEFCDDLPDPNKEPRQILMDFLDVLNNLGLWCADRAALYALVEVEKLKKKTAYDRHYLLLCMIFTVMARIRAVVEQAFDKFSELDQILKFSTPKVLRLVEILRQVRPLNFVDPRKRRDRLEGLENGKPVAAIEGSEEMQMIEDSPEEGSLNKNCPEDPMEATVDGNTENPEGSTSDFVTEISNEGSEEPSDTATLCVRESIYEISESPLVSSGDGAKEPVESNCEDDENSTPNHELTKNLDSNSQIHFNNVDRGSTEEPMSTDENSAEDKSDISHGAPLSMFCESSIEDSSEVVDLSTDGGYFTAVSDASPKCTSKAVSDSYTNDIEDCLMKSNRNNSEVNVSRVIGVNAEHFHTDITVLHSRLQDSMEETVEITKQGVKERAADGMHITVQTCPEATQYCSNTCKDVVAKTIDEDGSTLEDSLCRLNIKESSCTDGCDTESIKSCDLHNGVLSAKNELLDTANIKNMKNVILCNGIEHVNEEEIMDSKVSEKDITSKMNGHVDPSDCESEDEDISDNYKSCESVQSQASLETSSNGGSISDTIAPSATSDLPCVVDDTSAVDESLTENGHILNSQESPVVEDGMKDSQNLPACSSSETTNSSDSAAFSNAGNGTQVQVVSSEAAAMADTLAMLLPNSGKGRKRRDDVKEKVKVHNPEDPDSVCGLVFVHHRSMAKIIYRLLKELSDIGGDFAWIFPQYTVEAKESVKEDPRAAEAEHKKQEEVLRRFRHHECNILVSTRVLEEGIDVPQCNLVLRFDPPTDYRSYVHSCGRARGHDTFYFHLITKNQEHKFLHDMATYSAFQQVLVSHCGSVEVGTDREVLSSEANAAYAPYITPAEAAVTMASAIGLLNKYCAKLPSDTFTRLTAMWDIEDLTEMERQKYKCKIMLPINSPLKGTIEGPWQEKVSLAKMAAALECCRRLHQMGELDDQLQPVGKESMKLDDHLCAPPADDQVPEGMPRPGTTKRRQYYYKKVAVCLTGEQPKEELDLFVYKLDMVLTCPIPDEQNTRGRKIYRPEQSSRSFGIITTKPISQVSGFPVFTRSGEVVVHVQQIECKVSITQDQLSALQYFHKFTFTHVLRLEKYPIKFDPTNARTTFYIVPLNKFNGCEGIDWEFVKEIQSEGDPRPIPPQDDVRKKFQFQHDLYEDAVVMPWYRNQDQPQYFYVAEICTHLNPQSDFPDAGFETFEKYYLTKYGLQICNLAQPLLDVDHTSGRLNLLTPRHVNRKGVALPTTSEETKRAKRENLQQKQILVPELCTIHPFPASLWRKAVCLPTILYRINALLLADQLRLSVASEVGLGLQTLLPDFSWPPLDFGWSLADVLRKNQENQDQDEKSHNTSDANSNKQKAIKAEPPECESPDSSAKKKLPKKGNDMEIGTWSNDMAVDPPTPPFDMDTMNGPDEFEIDTFDPNVALPDNLTLLNGFSGPDDDIEGELGADWGTGITERRAKTSSNKDNKGGMFRVGSPSNFESDGWDMFGGSGYNGGYGGYGSYDAYGGYGDFQGLADDLEGCESDVSSDMEDDDKSQTEKLWDEDGSKRRSSMAADEGSSDEEIDLNWPDEDEEIRNGKENEFQRFLEEKQDSIKESTCYLSENESLVIEKAHKKLQNENKSSPEKITQCTEGSTVEGCEQISSKGCDNAQQSTSIIIRIVNRNETLTLKRPDPEVQCSSWNSICEEMSFSFDFQPDLLNHPGPSPSVILQALTMSNANDGVNLERLETIGDSFLKYAITTFLYCTYPQRHEGKLSYLRSKQVSNLNLYRLGKRKGLGECMVATKFEPHDNWLPPGYFVPRELEEALIDSGVPAGHWNMADLPGLHDLASDEIRRLVQERSEQIKRSKSEQVTNELMATQNPHDLPIFIPYNLLTQHSIPDKSIADCVEALIGAYLTTCGPRGALLFMSWLGIKVLPCAVGITAETTELITYGHLESPQSPLYHCPLTDTQKELDLLLSGYQVFEEKIGYTFRDRSYLLQAFTHASYYKNRLTDCYQRLEFLGDAVLDYLITRHLYEDKRQHSPGALTDLRSALVNNTIFASLAVKYDYHKYFRHFSPGLDRVIRDFVKMQEENGHKINEEYYFMEEDECEAAEDIEVPKALGDVFESVAGAIFLDSGSSLDAVWSVYYTMMCREIEQFSGVVPKSPIRELLEMEPETAKFGKPERLVDGKVRVSVEIFGKGSFSGVGRNYRIAKSTAAKRALRHLKKLQMMANQGI